MKLIRLFLLGAVLLLIIACNSEQLLVETTPEVSNAAKDATKEKNPPAGAEPATGSSIQEFRISARKWEFAPSTITVNKGELVRLLITSEDVEHGFSLPKFNVNEQLSPGQTVEIQFVADTAGTFTFLCNVYCGEGHGGMEGELIVR